MAVTDPGGTAGPRDRLLPNAEAAGGLMIRARQAHDDVAADPDRFRPVAEALVTEARGARQPEALALALRALARAERARLDDRSALRLLDEACRIARRHRLTGTLADLLMSRADVGQELGRLTAARRDLEAAAALVTGGAPRWNWTSTAPYCCRTADGCRPPRSSTAGCCPTRGQHAAPDGVREQPGADRVRAGPVRLGPAPPEPGAAGAGRDRPRARRLGHPDPALGHRAVRPVRRGAGRSSRRPRRHTGPLPCRSASTTSSTPMP